MAVLKGRAGDGGSRAAMTPLTRRRFIFISAAGAALAALPPSAWPSAALTRWRGTALGADAAITLAHADGKEAETLIAAARAEIERLDAIFSLYRPASALSRLNRAGQIANPPFDLLALLAEADRVHRLTDGAFDPTVQPAWSAFADHFSEPLPHGPAPHEEIIEAARARIGWPRVAYEPASVRFAAPAMALTLNGIAQGYVTDRIADLLRAGGLGHVLVEIGELRAVGPRPDGTPWRIALAAPPGARDAAEAPAADDALMALADRALATSAPLGTTFDAGGSIGHIIDPRTGRPAGRWRQASVLAPTAALADGLSTAFCLMERAQIEAVLAGLDGVSARLVDDTGRLALLPA